MKGEECPVESKTANLLVCKKAQAQYQWLYTQLEYTNRAIAPILTAFRFRTIKQEFVQLYEPV